MTPKSALATLDLAGLGRRGRGLAEAEAARLFFILKMEEIYASGAMVVAIVVARVVVGGGHTRAQPATNNAALSLEAICFALGG